MSVEETRERLEKAKQEVLNPTRYSIELDCAPGWPRPSDLLPGVLEGTGVTLDVENTTMRLFGNWQWLIPDDQVEAFLAARETIKARIKALYENGTIRYGSW